jgi:hypothetical protein
MCAHIIVKGSVCSVCVILLLVKPLFPGYASGYYLCSGCISLRRVFVVEGFFPLDLSRSVLLYFLSLGRYRLVQFQFFWCGCQFSPVTGLDGLEGE